MDYRLNVQTRTATGTFITGNLSSFTIDITDNIPGNFNRNVPAITSVLQNQGIQLRKSNNGGKENLFFAILLKQVAACLSSIELALYSYDLSSLLYSIPILKELLLTMGLPEAALLSGQMETMAKENKLHDMRKLLQAVKNTIAQALMGRSEFQNC